MANGSFNIIRTSDQELVRAIKRLLLSENADDQLGWTEAKFIFLGADAGELVFSKDEFKSIENNPFVLEENSRLFQSMTITTAAGSVKVKRQDANDPKLDNTEPFDKVIVNSAAASNIEEAQNNYRKLLVCAQRHFSEFSINALGAFLGKDEEKYFKAREASLGRLEKLLGEITIKAEEHRQHLEGSYHEKAGQLETDFRNKETSLENDISEAKSELDEREKNLADREEQLNFQAAKAERRKVFQDLKKHLEEWDSNFRISEGTGKKRWGVRIILGLMTCIFAACAGYFLWLTKEQAEGYLLIVSYLRAGVFLALFASTGFWLVNYEKSWFQRHADEEFRLKRLQLDMQRAHWFVELSFQWRDEFESEVPDTLADRMTNGLFLDRDSAPSPPSNFDSLASTLLGASAKVKLSPSGTEVEIDKKGLKQVKKQAGATEP